MSTQRTYPFPYKTIPNIGKITCSGIDISNVSIVAVNPPPPEYTLTLPINAGAPGQVLQTDGTGILSWVNQPTVNPGTVTVVSASVPSFLSVAVTNPTTTPIINITYSGSALPVSSGGTGLIAVGVNGTVLRSNGSILQYGTTVDSISTVVPGGFLFTANVTFATTNPVITFAYSGTLPTTNGGTGLTTVGSNGQVLTSNGSSLFYSTPTTGTVTNFSANITPLVTSSFITATITNATTTPNLTINFPNMTGSNALVLNDRPTFLEWIIVQAQTAGNVTLGLFEDPLLNSGSYCNIRIGQSTSSTINSGRLEFYYDNVGSDSHLALFHRNKRLRWYGFRSPTVATLSSTHELIIDSPNSIRFTVQKTNPSPPPATLTRTLLYTGDTDFTFPTTNGFNGYPLLTNGAGVTSWGILGTTAGGTGLTSVGTANQVLTSNGTSLFWSTPTVGTVTSVSASVPTWLSVTVTNPTTTPFISITGTATGTGTVTVLQQDPTINGTLTLTDKMFIDRNSGNGQAIRIFNAHSTFPVDNYITIGHNSNSLNHGHFGHRMVASNSALNHLYWDNNGNRMQMDTTGNVGINTAPFTKFHVLGAPSSFGIQYLSSSATLSTVANSYDLIQRWYESTGNASYIDLGWIRTSTGGAWTTAGQRFQSLVDATYMGYIQFGGTNNNSGLTFGTGTSGSPHGVPEQVYINSSGNMGIGGHGSTRFGVGEGAFDGTRYGTIQITTSDTIISSTNNISQISFVRNGNYVHGIGYKQSTNIFGFGQGGTSNFNPNFLAINPSGLIGMFNDAPAYQLDVNGLGFAVRLGFSGGFRLGWNGSGGTGETNFYNYRGGGSGGFNFQVLNTSNNLVGWAPIECGAATIRGNSQIFGNGEMLKLNGVDHVYIRYNVNNTNYAFVGFSSPGATNFVHYLQVPSAAFAYEFYGSNTIELQRIYQLNNAGYAAIKYATPTWNCAAGLGGNTEGSGLIRNKYYVYQGGFAIVCDQNSFTGLGVTSPTQQLDVNGNIRTRNSFTSNNIDFFQYYTNSTFVPEIGQWNDITGITYTTGIGSNYPAGQGWPGPGPFFSSFTYNFRTCLISRIGRIITVNVDISYNFVVAGGNFPTQARICVILPAECRPTVLGAPGSAVGWPSTLAGVPNPMSFILLNSALPNGTLLAPEIVCDTNGPITWRNNFGANNQRLFLNVTYQI